MIWHCGKFRFDLERRTLLMGIVNVTPDSFSDGGRFAAPGAAVEHALRLAAEGAEIIDVGGESTRPGAAAVAPDVELARVLPVLSKLRAAAPELCLSIDTQKAEVARRALEAGAAIINDVSAFRADAAMLPLVAESNCGCVLMHMRGAPENMQAAPRYDDVVREVGAFLAERVRVCEQAGIGRERIALDPGIGFGKTVEHNLQLLNRLEQLAAPGLPVLIGASRKSFIGRALDLDVDQRLEASLAAAAIAALRGARIVRAHDARATRRALDLADAVRREGRLRESTS